MRLTIFPLPHSISFCLSLLLYLRLSTCFDVSFFDPSLRYIYVFTCSLSYFYFTFLILILMYLLSTFFIFIIHSFLFYFYHFSLSNFCFIPFIIFLVIPTCHWVVLLIDRCLLPLSLSLSLSLSHYLYFYLSITLSLFLSTVSYLSKHEAHLWHRIQSKNCNGEESLAF